MKILKIYIFLFSKSFDILTQLNINNDIQSILKNQRKYNLLINDFILRKSNEYLSKKKKINNQFFIDFLNELNLNHLKKRIIIFNKTKFFGKRLFQIVSFIALFIFVLKKLYKGFNNNSKYYKLNNFNYSGSKEFIPCFGFPIHAFTYQEKTKYPSSFIEYLILNNLIKKNNSLLSVDEYARPIKTEKHLNSNSVNRIFVNKKINLKKVFKIPINLFKTFRNFNREFKTKNLLLFIYYYEKKSKSNLILELSNTCVKKRINLKQFYFLTPFDIGLLKYDDKITNFNFYSYSQNEFIPPSINIHNEIDNQTNKLPINKILEEITLDLFSMYSHNTINLTKHLSFYNNTVEKIRTNYGLCLQSCMFEKKESVYSNLGFDKTINIELNSNKKNVLLFDLPIESYQSTLERQFSGDYFGTERFISSFYKSIIEIFASQEVNIFLKPKYSIHKENISSFYLKLINDFSSKNINLEIINPYDKIIIKDRKFDIMINLPYTSTHHTLKNLSYNNYFFVPQKYLKYFKYKNKNKNKNKKIIGSFDLSNLLNLKNGKNRR
jgi:hypothetical protein|tara:strand:+ start:24222 stop:25874 length:1653 start_codon:yes stop_codon:yes gene_type:complete